MIQTSIINIDQFKDVLLELPEDSYIRPCNALAGATIGQHTRHIIELYQCLLNGYSEGQVCYDSRKRDKNIEQKIDFAINQLQRIQQELEKPSKKLKINLLLSTNKYNLESNYMREVLYNLEHMIHHLALIKVAIHAFTDMKLPDSFGVAPSTIQFRKQCAQ